MDTKRLHVEVKDADRGEVEAVFSTFDVIDADGDVTFKDTFDRGAPVRISSYNHASWEGALPVGKGAIDVRGNQAVMKGQFFLNTTAGQETFEVVKQLGDLQEWSYGYDILEADRGEFNGKNAQFLRKLKVHEVSPVLVGASVGTRTLAVKSGNPEDGMKQFTAEERERLAESGAAMDDGSFPVRNREDLENAIRAVGRARPNTEERRAEVRRHIMRRARALRLTELIPDNWNSDGTLKLRLPEDGKAVLAALVAFRERAAEVLAMRREKGKGLGEESADMVEQIRGELREFDALLTAPAQTSEIEREWLRSIAANLE